MGWQPGSLQALLVYNHNAGIFSPLSISSFYCYFKLTQHVHVVRTTSYLLNILPSILRFDDVSYVFLLLVAFFIDDSCVHHFPIGRKFLLRIIIVVFNIIVKITVRNGIFNDSAVILCAYNIRNQSSITAVGAVQIYSQLSRFALK